MFYSHQNDIHCGEEMETDGQEANTVLMNLMGQPHSSISMKKLVEAINAIEDDKARTIVEFYYLSGARLCEGSTVTNPCELKIGASRPYGLFMNVTIENYEITPMMNPELQHIDAGRALVIVMATAKRGKHILKKNQENANQSEVTPQQVEETLTQYRQTALLKKWKDNKVTIDPKLIEVLNGRLHFKPIAIPLSFEYSPNTWVKDLLKHLDYNQKHGRFKTLAFDLSRQELRNAIRRSLKGILPSVALTEKGGSHSIKNILRHWRITHLIEYYNFNPAQLAAYTGWSVTTAFAKAGQVGGSANMENYVHLTWMTYLPNLCRPIDDFLK